MIHACYEFTGEDGSMGLTHNENYYLMVYELSLLERLFGHYPYSWKVIAYRPFDSMTPLYPYSCKETFAANWKKLPADADCDDVIKKAKLNSRKRLTLA